MAKVAITEQYLTDIADAIRSKTGLSSTFLPAEMAPAILTISGSGGITPSGTLSITANGTYNVTQYASASVNVPVGSTINNQNKTVTPTESSQSITYDSGYTGLGTVTVGAISDTYVGSAIDVNPTPTASGAIVTIPAGYYNTQTTKSVASGTAGTPSASKGTVSNHSISVTPSVTNTTGYITGGTKTGTAVSVSASELVSGTLSVTSNGTKDVTNYASINVNISGDAPTLQTKTYTVDSAGTATITADSGYDGLSEVEVSVPSASAVDEDYASEFYNNGNTRKWRTRYWIDYNNGGFIDGVHYGLYLTRNAVPSNTSITPTESSQTIGGTNYMMEGAVTVNAIPSNYVGSGITQRSSSDLTASGATVTVPSGYYSAQASKVVASGTEGTPIATKGSVSNHSISVTPSVTNTTGYITGSTKTGTAVTVSASELVSGSQTVTENGTVDVTNLASVVVSVSGGGGGGGAAAKVGTATTTPSYAATSISFTGLLGEPTSFAVVSNAELTTGASPWKTAAVVYDGTDLHGQTIRNTSNAQVTYDGSSFSYTYNNGTLTITGSGTNFQANQYKLVYTYGSATVGTAQTQVGSGATSITFTGVTDEPAYFSCIFKSNFSTSSGYQRVIVVVNDGTSTYGMEMDSSAKVSTAHWSYNYNNGSLTITSQGTNAGGYFHQPGYYQLTYVAGGGDEVILQDKTVSPTESTQYVTADSDYTGLGTVTVNAISSTYVGSGITRRSSTDLTASGATVTVPSGYYSAQASKAVASGTAGTPTATKGTVSNHSVSVTPSVTNTTGWIAGSTKTGTAVTVTASELASGNKSITENGTDIDVVGYSTVSVSVSSSSPTIQSLSITPTTSQQTFNASDVDGYKPVTVAAMPTMTLPTTAASSATSGYTSKATIGRSTAAQYINIPPGYNSTGAYYVISAVANGSATAPASISGTAASVSTGNGTLTLTKTVSVTPSVTAGYVSSGTAGNSSVSLTASVTIDPTPTASGATVTIPAGYYTEATSKAVTTMTLPTSAASNATSGYTKKATISRSTSTQYINIAPGYNSAGGYYEISAVANGSATGPSSLSGSSATVSTGTNTLTLTKTGVTTTPTVTAGYVSSATASTATVTLTASVTTKAAATITPTTTNQTIAAGTYLTGTQTIAGDADLVGGNILSTANIFGVQGTVVVQNYYTGSSAPSSSLGQNGDIYIQQ